MRVEVKEIEISPEDLEKIKEIQLEILIELDRICRAHGIKYNICAGTLLGAVRHKGFIPWDDDIDVRMLRSEYERFCKVCETELDTERFFLQNHKTDPNYRWQYVRILRNGTDYKRAGHEHLKQRTGLFIDILISDGVPKKELQMKWFKLWNLVNRKILWSPVGARVCEKASQRLFFGMLSLIPTKIPFAIFEYHAKKYDERNCDTVTCMGLKPDVHIFGTQKIQKFGLNRAWHTELTELEFEGHMFYAPADYEQWLIEGFGTDYMELPPVEKRRSHQPASYYKLLDE